MPTNRNPLASSTLITWMISGVILIIAAYFVFYSAGINPESLSHFGGFFGGLTTGIGLLFAGLSLYFQRNDKREALRQSQYEEKFNSYIHSANSTLDKYEKLKALADEIDQQRESFYSENDSAIKELKLLSLGAMTGLLLSKSTATIIAMSSTPPPSIKSPTHHAIFMENAVELTEALVCIIALANRTVKRAEDTKLFSVASEQAKSSFQSDTENARKKLQKIEYLYDIIRSQLQNSD